MAQSYYGAAVKGARQTFPSRSTVARRTKVRLEVSFVAGRALFFEHLSHARQSHDAVSLWEMKHVGTTLTGWDCGRDGLPDSVWVSTRTVQRFIEARHTAKICGAVAAQMAHGAVGMLPTHTHPSELHSCDRRVCLLRSLLPGRQPSLRAEKRRKLWGANRWAGHLHEHACLPPMCGRVCSRNRHDTGRTGSSAHTVPGPQQRC
jgi:hypothetical protein